MSAIPLKAIQTPNPLFEQYAAYTAGTEPMWWYHRWCLYSAVGALLGRRFYFQHGHFTVNPNLYCMLIGDTGSRKSTAIKMVRKLVRQTETLRFAQDRGSKEGFLIDLAGHEGSAEVAVVDMTVDQLFGTGVANAEPREIYVVADEFNEFIGINNTDFASMLGNLWDYEGTFEYKLKNSKPLLIPEPTVNILGGNTAQGLVIAFPQELLGQGFFGRVIIIHGEKSDRKITFPKKPAEDDTLRLVAAFQKIHLSCRGAVSLSTEAGTTLDSIYQDWPSMPDTRFRSYANRRFTQLLKLCTINAATRYSSCISESDVILANTVLAAAEELMPKALGEFGKSKNSGTATKVLEILDSADTPLSIMQIWKHVHKDLGKIQELGEIMQGLEQAEKIQHVPKKGWLPKKQRRRDLKFVDWKLLSTEEISLLSKA